MGVCLNQDDLDEWMSRILWVRNHVISRRGGSGAAGDGETQGFGNILSKRFDTHPARVINLAGHPSQEGIFYVQKTRLGIF